MSKYKNDGSKKYKHRKQELAGIFASRMEQWDELKAKYPDARLMFHVGDFYELYKQDAIRAAEILGLTIIKRENIASVAFPYHALDTYLLKLIRAKERVAIFDDVIFDK